MAKNTVSCFSGSNFFIMYFETNQKIKDVMSDVDEQQILVHFRLNLNNISLYFRAGFGSADYTRRPPREDPMHEKTP
jgi:hypothetical protein